MSEADSDSRSAQDQVARLVQIMARLRDPERGCPWDLQQDHRSLCKFLLEECYEVIEAAEQADDDLLEEELGDLLLQIVFHCQIAKERGRFDLHSVARRICDKLERRHPHVFGDVVVADAAEVVRNWEEIKREERGGAEGERSLLDGVPKALPALRRAEEVQKRASTVGFDWHDVAGPLAKAREELAELEQAIAAGDKQRAGEELGDALFALVNVGRFVGVSAEQALREAVRRFIFRFAQIEQEARRRGLDLREMTLEQMDLLWEEAKGSGDKPCGWTSSSKSRE